MRRFLSLCFPAVFILLSCSSQDESQTADKSKIRPVLEEENVEYAYPHFSNDATRILFQSNKFGNWRICTADIDGKNIVELTTDTSNCYFPDWSPDNALICFVSDRTGAEEIYLMNVDGTGQRQITDNGARNIHPYYSPDGKKILYSSSWQHDDRFEIYQVNPDGTDIERITDSPDNKTCARMSPAGGQIVYLRNNSEGLDDVFLLTVADSIETNLTNTAGWDGWPSWSADGQQILFSAVQDDVFKLFAYDLGTQSLTRLTNPALPYDDCRASVSSDGKLLIFNRQHDTEDGRTNAIYLMEL